VAIHPMRHAPPLAVLILTIGASIAIRGTALVLWGTDPAALPAFSSGPPFRLLGATMVRQGLWVIGVAALVFALLWFFFTRTYAGSAVRACAVNARGARLMGIRVDRMFLLAFALSGALGAVAGAVIAPITYATYDMGLMLGLKGFVAAVLGGLVSPPGAIVGGVLLGLLESFSAGLLSSGYKDAVAFVVLIALLLVQAMGWLPWRIAEEA
jgi:branched-chain amino acid transport system permease protein